MLAEVHLKYCELQVSFKQLVHYITGKSDKSLRFAIFLIKPINKRNRVLDNIIIPIEMYYPDPLYRLNGIY